MSHFPLEVRVNETQIARLTTVYKNAYKQIVAEIESATDWGVANRRAILAQIEGILTELGADVGRFIEQEIPDYYQSGVDDAAYQLKSVGANVELAAGLNKVNHLAIDALVSETAEAFGESLTGVNRSARLLMSRATKEKITQQLATGTIQGSTNKAIGKAIKSTLREQGLDALVDKGGHSWTLDRYSEMLIRTKAVEARNRGLEDRMLQNGYDLVQVSRHNSSHEECAVWEGQIVSLTGNTPGYKTLDDAKSAGLLHPNCKHAINVINLELATKTRAYDFRIKGYGAPGASIKSQ